MTIKLRTLVKWPARVVGGDLVEVTKENGVVTIDLALGEASVAPSISDTDATMVVLVTPGATDDDPDVVELISVADFNAAISTIQTITTGNVTVVDTDSLIVVNKTVGAATTVTLPAAADKIGPVKIVDFKGDGGTNAITINAAGSDKFNGNLSSWVIGSDGGSVVLHPHSGGWAV